MTKTIIRKPYSRQRSPFLTDGESSTKQSFKAECDVNNILKRYKKTGLLEHVSQYGGNYADLSEPTDYQTALNIVLEADAAFSTLPSDVRIQFQNSPHEFLEFVNNPDNSEKLVEMGLANPPEKPAQASPAPAELDTPPTEVTGEK